MNRKKAWNDLSAILNNLGDSLLLYRYGRKDAYRSVAIGLNTLLCDKNNVLTRIFPTAALSPLNSFAAKLSWEQSYLLKDLAFSPPGTIVFDGKGYAKIENLFYQEKLLLLDKWLAQPLINKHITLKEFITSIANKEGKHPDPEYNKTLKLVRGVSLANIEIHPELIVTIGEYVSGLLNHIIRDLFSEKEIETWIKSKWHHRSVRS